MNGNFMKGKHFDAVVVLCGGLDKNGTPHPWVRRRLDQVLHFKTKFAIIPGRSTANKPPLLNKKGFPVDESIASAAYLARRGFSKKKILITRTSMDTIGDAYFTRVLVIDPLGFKRILVITSDHHMPRTQAIFSKIFSLKPHQVKYQLEFQSVSDHGFAPGIMNPRLKKEAESLKKFRRVATQFKNLRSFTKWLLTKHGVYSYANAKVDHLDNKTLSTY